MYLLDTDVVVDHLREKKPVLDSLLSEDLYITTISVAELFHGIYNSSKKKENTEKLIKFLSNVEILTIDLNVCDTFGMLKAKLKKEGNLIDNMDLFIASICLRNGLILITNNEKHFKKVKTLKILSIK